MCSPQAIGLTAIPEIVEIARHCFPVVWGEKDFAYFLTHECGLCLGVFEGERPRLAAYFLGLLVRGDLDVISIACHPNYRRQGLAERLLGEALRRPGVERAVLEVAIENQPAIRLYQKLGFRVQGERKKYYQGRGDAYLMIYP